MAAFFRTFIVFDFLEMEKCPHGQVILFFFPHSFLFIIFIIIIIPWDMASKNTKSYRKKMYNKGVQILLAHLKSLQQELDSERSLRIKYKTLFDNRQNLSTVLDPISDDVDEAPMDRSGSGPTPSIFPSPSTPHFSFQHTPKNPTAQTDDIPLYDAAELSVHQHILMVINFIVRHHCDKVCSFQLLFLSHPEQSNKGYDQQSSATFGSASSKCQSRHSDLPLLWEDCMSIQQRIQHNIILQKLSTQLQCKPHFFLLPSSNTLGRTYLT